MDHTVARLENSEECEQFAINVAAKHPELALEARRRSIHFMASTHGEVTEVEFAGLQAIHASEQAIRKLYGRKGVGLRPWPIVKKLGILPALEKLAADTRMAKVSAAALVEVGMEDMTYDSVIQKYPDSFTPVAVNAAKRRSGAAEAALAAAE